MLQPFTPLIARGMDPRQPAEPRAPSGVSPGLPLRHSHCSGLSVQNKACLQARQGAQTVTKAESKTNSQTADETEKSSQSIGKTHIPQASIRLEHAGKRNHEQTRTATTDHQQKQVDGIVVEFRFVLLRWVGCESWTVHALDDLN